MKKIRALLLAIALLFTAVGVSTATQSTVASAAVGNCTKAGSYYPGGHSAGIWCGLGVPGDAIRITIRCQYRLYGVYHTYSVYGGWAYWRAYDPANAYGYGTPGYTGWSSASCGDHWADAAYQERMIGACPQLNNAAAYWSSSYCF